MKTSNVPYRLQVFVPGELREALRNIAHNERSTFTAPGYQMACLERPGVPWKGGTLLSQKRSKPPSLLPPPQLYSSPSIHSCGPTTLVGHRVTLRTAGAWVGLPFAAVLRVGLGDRHQKISGPVFQD